jgi:predicted amidohydrolase YtcJ
MARRRIWIQIPFSEVGQCALLVFFPAFAITNATWTTSILQSKDCHALWVSSKVMEISGPFPDVVEGGVIFRDDSGQPNGQSFPFRFTSWPMMVATGMFLDNAQDIIFQPALTDDDLLRRFTIAVQDVMAVGLTSVHDAGLNPASLKFFSKFVAEP